MCDQKGFFIPAFFLDNDSVIADGGKIYGSPKKLAEAKIRQNGDIFVGTCVKNSIKIIPIITRVIEPATEDNFSEVFPVYDLKMISAVDRPEPVVKKITGTGIDNPKLYWMYKCAGSVQFSLTTAGNSWKLQPEEIIGASRFKMDYEQGFGKVVCDYLVK